ncbi:transcriptional regulator [Pasteurellaceae bacterium Macca]|nr:transcriptional regulator [Pasteurellaceae bacterium Macca]
MLSNDNFPERIELAIAKSNGPSEFSRKMGVTLSTITRWRKGDAEPSRPNLIKIAEVSGVDLKWLATGESPELSENKQESHIEQAVEKAQEKQQEGVTMIDSFNSIIVSAGYGSFNEGVTDPDGEEPYSDSLLQTLGVKARHCAVFWANGSSMFPTIDDGDQLLVDLSKKEVRGDDKIYLVQNGDSVWVKRIRRQWNRMELISDNSEEYEPISISAEEGQYLQIIGQVVHIGHSLV